VSGVGCIGSACTNMKSRREFVTDETCGETMTVLESMTFVSDINRLIFIQDDQS